MSDVEEGVSLAATILTRLGFQVEHISTGIGRTADLRVTGENSYIVEVKDKDEPRQLTKEREAALKRGDVHEQSDLLARNERIRSILKYARKQLDETPKNSETFQLVWLHGNGFNDGLRVDQAFDTFYGRVSLQAVDPPRAKSKPCFYFDHNAGFEMPTVEALILTGGGDFQICLNEFSVRSKEFRASDLCCILQSRGCVSDPVELAATGQIIACRATCPRKDDAVVVAALKEQTGTLYEPIRFTEHSVLVPVSR